jgi:hypothetical protein
MKKTRGQKSRATVPLIKVCEVIEINLGRNLVTQRGHRDRI